MKKLEIQLSHECLIDAIADSVKKHFKGSNVAKIEVKPYRKTGKGGEEMAAKITITFK